MSLIRSGFEALSITELFVEAAGRHELGVSALLDHLTLVNDHNAVSCLDRGQPVSYHQTRSA